MNPTNEMVNKALDDVRNGGNGDSYLALHPALFNKTFGSNTIKPKQCQTASQDNPEKMEQKMAALDEVRNGGDGASFLQLNPDLYSRTFGK